MRLQSSCCCHSYAFVLHVSVLVFSLLGKYHSMREIEGSTHNSVVAHRTSAIQFYMFEKVLYTTCSAANAEAQLPSSSASCSRP